MKKAANLRSRLSPYCCAASRPPPTAVRRIARADAGHNCIFNARPQGLRYEEVTCKLHYLLSEPHRHGLSGVALKDETASEEGSWTCAGISCSEETDPGGTPDQSGRWLHSSVLHQMRTPLQNEWLSKCLKVRRGVAPASFRCARCRALPADNLNSASWSLP